MTSAPARLELSATDRQRLGQRAQLLAGASVTYNVIEAAIAIRAGVVAGSAVLLLGLVLNATLGWSWADPIAGLVIAAVAAREGRDAWRGQGCCGSIGSHDEHREAGCACAGDPADCTDGCCALPTTEGADAPTPEGRTTLPLR